MSALIPNRTDFRWLLRKYRVLLRLRYRRDHGGGVASKCRLQTLSRHYPTALAQLETAPDEELRNRTKTLSLAIDSAQESVTLEAWIIWELALHRVLRAALDVRQGAEVNARSQVLGEALGVEVTGEALRSIAFAPNGRVSLAAKEFVRRAVCGSNAPD